jgi:hypothetical protein
MAARITARAKAKQVRASLIVDGAAFLLDDAACASLGRQRPRKTPRLTPS